MLSPSEKSAKMRLHDVAHFSSQYTVGSMLEDTVSSVRHARRLLGSSTTISSVALNFAFAQLWWLIETHCPRFELQPPMIKMRAVNCSAHSFARKHLATTRGQVLLLV